MAIQQSDGSYYLVLNPDVALDPKARVSGVRFLEANQDVGLAAPLLIDDNAGYTHLCKRCLDFLTLLIRGSGSADFCQAFRNRVADYEMGGWT